jgi:hypothetical protein
MKGRILGFAEASGVITGDDGKRYRFGAGDWKAPRPPRAGEEVDYEISAQGLAAEIYPLRGAPSLDLGDVSAKMKDVLGGADLSGMGAKAREIFNTGAGSPTAQRAIALVKTRFSVPLALILLLVSLAFGYVRWIGPQLPFVVSPKPGSYSVLAISGFAGSTGSMLSGLSEQASQDLAPQKQQRDELARQGDRADAERIGQDFAKTESAATEATLGRLTLDLMYLLYLIPLGSLLILFLEWNGKPMPLANLVVGGLGVLAFVLAFVARMFVNGALRDFSGNLVDSTGENSAMVFGMATGFGCWVLFIVGGVLLLHALGIIGARR